MAGMSKGHGEVQRHILARLAQNTAEDTDIEPRYQSWTSLENLCADTPYIRESVRRAVGKLAADGIVETKLLYTVSWRHSGGAGPVEEIAAAGRPEPAARLHTYRNVNTGESWAMWNVPLRCYGNRQLHARLAR